MCQASPPLLPEPVPTRVRVLGVLGVADRSEILYAMPNSRRRSRSNTTSPSSSPPGRAAVPATSLTVICFAAFPTAARGSCRGSPHTRRSCRATRVRSLPETATGLERTLRVGVTPHPCRHVSPGTGRDNTLPRGSYEDLRSWGIGVWAGARSDAGRARHHVPGLARSRKGGAGPHLGGTPVEANLFDENSLAAAASGAEVVIHAATAIPDPKSARPLAAWSRNDRIRREGTRALTAAAARVGARRYLQQSVVWIVKSRGRGEPYDEDTPPNPPLLLRTAIEAETIARDAGARHGFGVGILRGGCFYGPDTTSRAMAEMLLARRLPIIGSGENLVASIHPEDIAHAFVLAAEAEVRHVARGRRPAPPLATVLACLPTRSGAAAAQHPALAGPDPRGKHVVESLTTPMNTTNARIRRELVGAAHPLCARLAATVEAWRRRASAKRGGRAKGNASDARTDTKRHGSAARSGPERRSFEAGRTADAADDPWARDSVARPSSSR